MTKFNITTHNFVHEGEEYFLKPLTGEYIDLFFKVLGQFQDVNEKIESEMPENATEEEREKISSSKFLTYLPKDALKDLHVLTVATFVRSYPDMKEDDIDSWVTKNLFTLMNHVIQANMHQGE